MFKYGRELLYAGVMNVLQEGVFLSIFNLFHSSYILSGFAIFIAEYFPFLLMAIALLYELFVRKDGETLRSLLRIYFPPFLTMLTTETSKLFFIHPRPFIVLHIIPLIHVSDPYGSFPSSHAAFFAALAMTMYSCNHKLGKWFFFGALIVGLGRVAVGVHWPLDVVSGFLIGSVLGYAYEKLISILYKSNNQVC